MPDDREVMATSGDRLSILHDHYQDSCVISRELAAKRDRQLIWLAIMLAVVLVDIITPTSCLTIFRGIVIKNLDPSVKIEIPTPVVALLMRGLLFWLTLRYFQAVLAVERLYPTIHFLERQLNEGYGKKVFIREGEAYLERYPYLLDVTHHIYVWGVPMLLIATLAYRTYTDIIQVPAESWAWFVAKLAVSLAIVAIAVLYLIPNRAGGERFQGVTACATHDKTEPDQAQQRTENGKLASTDARRSD